MFEMEPLTEIKVNKRREGGREREGGTEGERGGRVIFIIFLIFLS